MLRDKLFGAVLLGSALAIAIALLGAALVARTVTAPLHRVVAAARRLQAGDLGARAEAQDAPGELGELSRAFDGMAHTLVRTTTCVGPTATVALGPTEAGELSWKVNGARGAA